MYSQIYLVFVAALAGLATAKRGDRDRSDVSVCMPGSDDCPAGQTCVALSQGNGVGHWEDGTSSTKIIIVIDTSASNFRDSGL
ncbi:hypothetical protein CDD83_10053 [Cordyceps sp. RAO-2017]|nr:hypothetical protein CDD83_10053 [Cordyceps sp. RAO-2017]